MQEYMQGTFHFQKHANILYELNLLQNQFHDRAMPKIIQTYGGLEDHIVDVFGFKMPICPENGGFTTDGRFVKLSWGMNYFQYFRQTILHLNALNEDQPAWVPKFTKIGFEKIKIPADIYRMLMKEYERVKPSMQVEGCAKAVINCEEIIDSEDESSLRSSRRTFIMNLR